jgi:aquaporin Z
VHPLEWTCEMVGTAFQLFLGFSAVALFESRFSPLSTALPSWSRLVVIGACFGLLAAAVALSPLGRRSGAHLNPAVTLGFVLRGHTSARDAAGFMAGQFVGALSAAVAFRAVEGRWASSVHVARTAPSGGLADWAVAGIEAGLTATLLLVIFTMLSSARTARWTPLVVVGALSGLILLGAPHTGASMNPARTAGPDIVTDVYPALWAYVIGPLSGAAVAVALFDLFGRGRQTLTAKLFHDPDYPSVHATTLPARSQTRRARTSAGGAGPGGRS